MEEPHATATEDTDDELPPLESVLQRTQASHPTTTSAPGRYSKEAKVSTVRRRNLSPRKNANFLFMPWDQNGSAQEHVVPKPTSPSPPRQPLRPRGPRVELRTRKNKKQLFSPISDKSEFSTEEASVLEDLTLEDDSEFCAAGSSSDDDDSDGSITSPFRSRSPTKSRNPAYMKPSSHHDHHHATAKRTSSKPPTDGRKQTRARSKVLPGIDKQQSWEKENEKTGSDSLREESSQVFYSAEEDPAILMSRLQVDVSSQDTLEAKDAPPRPPNRSATPPPQPKPNRLVSPTKKIPRIPTTPHRPSVDAFWNQEFVDDWNMEHSPRKLLFDPEVVKKSPSKQSPAKKTEAARKKEAKKLFENAKRDIAARFLEELDRTVTGGKLAELASSTDGIQIIWTNKLNTTAGRANWKRETLRERPRDGSEGSVRHRHHASIELAEKVIDDEHRLLNVIAHEFCHLANFMIHGVTGNPHGKEFKAWAAKCSRLFADRGIQVTTKHSYDIDFKYVWECTACRTEFKRHSKSINPERHRCGSCKSQLVQTKPVPRSGGVTTASEYQKFMKEQMKMVRKENPGSPQKEIMKLVAEKWASERSRKNSDRKTCAPTAPDNSVDRVVDGLVDLTLEDK